MKRSARTRTTGIGAAAGAIACLLVAGAGAAHAAPARSHAKATLAFVDKSVIAGIRASLSYQTSAIPGGSVAVVQRQFGSANVWRKVAPASGGSGTVSVPAVAMGLYHYRLHVTHDKKLVVNSDSQPLYAYGTINLSALCNNEKVQIDCEPDTEQVGSSVLPYEVRSAAPTSPDYSLAVKAADSSCRTVTARWGIENEGGVSGDTTTLTVVRSDADPQAATVQYGFIGDLNAKLDRGAWNIDLAITSSRRSIDYVALNATLSCYTNDGTR